MNESNQRFADTPEFVDLFDLYGVMLREEVAYVGDALRLYKNVLNVELAALDGNETRYGAAIYGDDEAAPEEAISASWRTMAKARLIATVDSLNPSAVEAIANPKTNLERHLTEIAFSEGEEF